MFIHQSTWEGGHFLSLQSPQKRFSMCISQCKLKDKGRRGRKGEKSPSFVMSLGEVWAHLRRLRAGICVTNFHCLTPNIGRGNMLLIQQEASQSQGHRLWDQGPWVSQAAGEGLENLMSQSQHSLSQCSRNICLTFMTQLCFLLLTQFEVQLRGRL